MKYKLQSIVALTAAFTPGLSNAIGLGEITLQSRIGETLMAEVPLLSTAAEPPQATCFTLKPVPGSDFPVVTAAKPRLVRRGDHYVVQLIGTKPISDPIYAIRLSAACGYDLERDYVLMPEAPLMFREAATTPPQIMPPRKPGKLTEQLARDGETLEDIADALAPATPAERQRIIADLVQANPNINANTPLAEGDIIMVPASKRAKRGHESASSLASTQGLRSTNPPPPAPAKKDKTAVKAAAPRDNKDRLILDMAPEDEKPRSKGAATPASLAEAEERLVKLETTLRLLTQEVAKMDEALDLVTKAIEAQNKLHQAQGAPNAQPSAMAVKTTPPAAQESNSPQAHWLELLVSAGLGVGVSVGFAQYLGRRRRYPGEDQTPLALAGYRHEVEPNNRTAAPLSANESAPETAAPTVAPAPEAPAPREREVPRPQETGAVELRTEDDHSVLELAEIMLSFGRLKGAADTLAVYIEETLPESFQPWSMLLDLYRRGAMRDEFEALATKMRTRFNAKIPDWEQLTTPVSGLKTLEDYPHVTKKMLGIWGTQDCIDYLFNLVHDTRAGQRNGFPLEVVEEIALLIHVLETGYNLKRQA